MTKQLEHTLLEHLQDSLYFISVSATLYLFKEQYSPTLLSILSLFLLFYFNFFFSLLISCLPPQSTEIGANHHPRLPPVSHPHHKHLKIGNPQSQTVTGKSPTPQTPQDRQPHNHTHGSITATAPPPRRDRRRPPHPGRDRRANPRRANPKHPMKNKIT